jgi:periplasmic protein TonB
MSSDNQPRVDLVALPGHGGIATARRQAPEVVVTGNVVPFVRPQPAGAALVVDPLPRPAPDVPRPEGRGRIVGLLALSLVIHGGLFVLFNREPQPLASIALPAISVEIVLGADAPAGVATTARQQEVDTAANDPKEQQTAPETETAKQEETPPEPQSPPVETAATETPPELPAAAEKPPEPETTVAAVPAEPTPEPRAPEPVALPEQPRDAAPPPPARAKPEPQPKPVQHRAPKPKQDDAAKRKPAEPRTRTANVEPGATARPSASGIGIGRAGTDTNYRGLVFAHLARHKQFPADARGRGEQGSAMVTFSLDGGGRVTRVSLVRSSGFSSLDQEAQAMVRRASPFPAPPDGRSVSFTAPASFRIQ